MTTTITGARVVGPDGVTGDAVDVEIDATIVSIRPAGTRVPAGDVVDGRGRFLAPGLVDTHAHLGSPGALQAAVAAGVTTLVDLGTHPDELIVEQRALSGVASVVSAGSAASAPGSTQIARMGFPAASGVTGPADAERFLDWRVEHGSELVKIIVEDPAATDVPALEVATIAALVDGARRRGLLTVAHVVTAAAFDRALDAGVDVLTHAPLDRPLPDATVGRMLDLGTASSPTLIMMRTMARARLGDRADAAFGNAVESVRRLHAAGVVVVAGTDANETPVAPVPHGPSLHEELALLQDAGLSAVEALRAGTTDAARSFRLADRGHVAVGLRADLLLLEADPITDTTALRQPSAVWVAGVPRATVRRPRR